MVHVSIAHGWEFEVERGPDWLFVRPRRPAKASPDSSVFADQVWLILEQHFSHRVVLEMGEVGRLDARLIDQLLELYDRIHAHDGMMRICGLSSGNQELLKKRQLEGRFPRFQDREEAVMGRPCWPR
jgi:hypothetical protein